MLGQVGDQLRAGEQQPVGGVLLHQLTVDPGAQAQRGGIDGAGVDHVGSQRGISVAALGADVGALVVGAQIVETEVVGGGDACDVIPGVGDPHVAGGSADHQGDFALEGQQLGACRPLDRAAGRRHRAGRLEEVGGMRGSAPALIGTRDEVEVDRDDLARPLGRRHEVRIGGDVVVGAHPSPLRRLLHRI